MDIRTYKENTRTHVVSLSQVEIDKILAEAVAAKAGLKFTDEHIDYAVNLGFVDGVVSYKAQVRIIENLALLPSAEAKHQEAQG